MPRANFPAIDFIALGNLLVDGKARGISQRFCHLSRFLLFHFPHIPLDAVRN
jgi:hypothetical protein